MLAGTVDVGQGFVKTFIPYRRSEFFPVHRRECVHVATVGVQQHTVALTPLCQLGVRCPTASDVVMHSEVQLAMCFGSCREPAFYIYGYR